MFRPSTVSAADVFETRKRLMRSFYSWKNVARRWWRLVSSYLRGSRRKGRLFGTLIITFVLFQLSRFQRYHAKKRVFPFSAPEVGEEREMKVAV